MASISIIIPTLNEADNIGSTLECLSHSGLVEEIIVVDGGSSDETAEKVRCCNHQQVSFIQLNSPSRAKQMNHGAAVAKGDLLVFLHADTLVPERSLEKLKALTASHATAKWAGGFERYFDSGSLFLQTTCWLANIRSRHSGIFLGDQGMFVSRENFTKLAGFDEQLQVGEDLDFSLRLRKVARIVALTPPVLTSARRFERRGPLGQTLRDVWIAVRILQKRQRK